MQKTTKSQISQKMKKAYSEIRVPVKKNILGVDVTDDTKENILEFIVQSIKSKTKPYYVVTPNPEMIVLASKNHKFRDILNNAKIASNDGIGVGLAGKILGKNLHERLTGVEMLESLCKRVADWPITVGFFGAGPKVAEKMAECLQKKYPGLKVSFAASDLPSGKFPETDILFIALGAPRQEFWMSEYVGKLPVRVMIGVGGAFDYISGIVPRAPKIVRSLGFEWLFRLIVQPWRLRRQLTLPVFAWMVVKKRLHM